MTPRPNLLASGPLAVQHPDAGPLLGSRVKWAKVCKSTQNDKCLKLRYLKNGSLDFDAGFRPRQNANNYFIERCSIGLDNSGSLKSLRSPRSLPSILDARDDNGSVKRLQCDFAIAPVQFCREPVLFFRLRSVAACNRFGSTTEPVHLVRFHQRIGI